VIFPLKVSIINIYEILALQQAPLKTIILGGEGEKKNMFIEPIYRPLI
jgi:hypothetical protein